MKNGERVATNIHCCKWKLLENGGNKRRPSTVSTEPYCASFGARIFFNVALIFVVTMWNWPQTCASGKQPELRNLSLLLYAGKWITAKKHLVPQRLRTPRLRRLTWGSDYPLLEENLCSVIIFPVCGLPRNMRHDCITGPPLQSILLSHQRADVK